jgi:1-pyrroline-5-carboxylate dehydrogenase
MSLGLFYPPIAKNEQILTYAPGTNERSQLKQALEDVAKEQIEIPVVIAGERIFTGNTGELLVPYDHSTRLGRYHRADRTLALQAADAALEAREVWSQTPMEQRMAIFLKAAELLTGYHRTRANAVTMLSLGKTALQSEIDIVCELADFLRFNVEFMHEIYSMQPQSAPNTWNRMEWRPLEGFIFAVTPFNFASIAGNLPSAPAMMGNTVVWKPASSAVYPAWEIMRIFEEAGLPKGVINFVPGSGSDVGNPILSHRELAGLHFTGSTETFRMMWQTIAKNIESTSYWPRIVGETGGKDFIFVHESADIDAVSTAIVQGAFEYQGQKCSAASRAYIPESLWQTLKPRLLNDLSRIKVGPVTDFTNFMTAVINKGAFESIRGYIEEAGSDPSCEIIFGGGCNSREGWYIEPTVILTSDPTSRTMVEEIFGPVITIYIYPETAWEETLDLCNRTSPYALTGAIFARDRSAIETASKRLRDAAGNFYINDKPTGAVVGQQPFGGGRASGTNDKAGSLINLLRWVSPRTIKETFLPATDFTYPFMAD